MKIYIKRFLEFLGFFILCLFFLIVTSSIFIPKWITNRDNFEKTNVDMFYKEKKNSLDIIFIGNSDFYHSISPMELWNKYGIVSYNYSHPGTRVWTDYYNIKLVLERQKPKYIFLNVDNAFTTQKSTDGDNAKVVTSMRLSKTKIEAILNRDVQKSYLIGISYLFPIIRFHSRYNDLTKEDFVYAFKKNYSPTKGYVMATKLRPYKTRDYMKKHKDIEVLPEKNIKYLDKTVELCKKNNIELILLETPSADSWNHKRHEAIEEYAKKRNLRFIDLNYSVTEMNFNWDIDTRDGGNHLNLYGALKVTDYLGNYIKDNLNVDNHKNEKKYNNWNKDYDNYLKLKQKSLNILDEKKKELY